MLSFAGIARNFRFMLLQVRKQLENTRALLTTHDPHYSQAIRGSEGYVDTQKSMIENECFAFIRRTPDSREADIATVRAVSVITNNLERIADFTVNITRQMEHFQEPGTLAQFQCEAYIAGMLDGLDKIEEALFERDSTLALRICQVEDDLDRLYQVDLRRVVEVLRDARLVEDLVTSLFVLHYLERMGDALLNIGEAILFAVLGERLKVHQYRVLEDAATNTPALARPLPEVDVDSIWGTRSGVRVGSLQDRAAGATDQRILFKEGNPEKLQRERDSLERWEQLAPGLVPAVVEYQRGGQGDALLLQYIDGRTLQDIVLNGGRDEALLVLDRLTATIDRIWTATRSDEPVNGRFLAQLFKRLDDVYRLHPEFREREIRIGHRRVPAFGERLEQAERFDAELAAPFSVFIHGDFNLDNILFEREKGSVHYVDVQRSRAMDYVQDVSVFLVSAFRLPVFIARTRLRLEEFALRFLGFVRDFASRHGDETFEARLALGLVRSFATSTRFELNRSFARRMQQRAVLLLERLDEHAAGTSDWRSFRVPDGVLLY
jgi:phosphate uptake regulator